MKIEKQSLSIDLNSHPHLATVKEEYLINDEYRILIAETEEFLHIRIRRLDDKPITEYQLFQDIKNEFIGKDKVGVQVFPKVGDYIDNTNTYHIFHWMKNEPRIPNLKEMYKYK
jgi:hypothetical protein